MVDKRIKSNETNNLHKYSPLFSIEYSAPNYSSTAAFASCGDISADEFDTCGGNLKANSIGTYNDYDRDDREYVFLWMMTTGYLDSV